MLVKLASRCNLGCKYCYVYELADSGWASQPKTMSPATVGALAGQLATLADMQAQPFEVVFHGGEPLLVGPARFECICSDLRRSLSRRIALGLQTNGVLLSDAIVATCLRHDISVSVSIDGPASVHDRHRPDRRGRPSHAAVVSGIERLGRFSSGRRMLAGLLAVIDLESDPIEVYEFLKCLRPNGIDFLYRDGNHEELPVGKLNADSFEYGAWLARLLDYYLRDPEPVPVRVLDEMLKLTLAIPRAREAVNGTEDAILVVETDGTFAKNDTLKGAYEGADIFRERHSVHKGGLVELLRSEEFSAYCGSQPPASEICRTCPDFGPCGGGTPAHRWGQDGGFDHPSVFCADQRHLIAAMRRQLASHGMTA